MFPLPPPPGTYLISLLQPSPEVFDLFDDVMLMAGRRVVFHGPVAEVRGGMGCVRCEGRRGGCGVGE